MKVQPLLVLCTVLPAGGLASACVSDDPLEPVVAIHGRELAAGYSVRGATFAANGDEILFHSGDQFRSVDVVTEKVRTLGNIEGRGSVNRAAAAPDRFYGGVRGVGGCYAIYEVPLDGSNPALLVDDLNASNFSVTQDGNVFAGFGLCRVGSEHLGIFDRATSQWRTVRSFFTGDILAFSPPGDLLLFGNQPRVMGDSGQFWLYDVSTKTSTPAVTVVPTGSRVWSFSNVRWFGEQPQVVVAERAGTSNLITLFQLNLVTGDRQSVATVGAGDASVGGAGRVAWSSRDDMAIWVPVDRREVPCVGVCTGGLQLHWQLILVTPTGQVVVVAEDLTPSENGWATFSRDGTRLAYGIQLDLYVIDVSVVLANAG